MDLSIFNFYLEPGNELDFANKLNKKLKERVYRKYIKGKIYRRDTKGWILSINISPSKRIGKIYILGPSVVRKHKDIYYTIRIPYKAIYGGGDAKKIYSHLVEQGLLQILSKDFYASK